MIRGHYCTFWKWLGFELTFHIYLLIKIEKLLEDDAIQEKEVREIHLNYSTSI